jgi:hypothetical protein
MDKPDALVNALLADLTPEELEPRLELQVAHDPLFTASCTINNAHGANHALFSPSCTNNNL